MKHLALLLCCLLSAPALAQESATPLVFKEWKNQQVLDAQNQVLRASNHLTQVRAGKAPLKKSARLPNDKVRDTTEDDQTSGERDLKRARDGLTAAQALTFPNYVEIYLPSIRDDAAGVQKLAEKLSKEELVEIFRALMKNGPGTDARSASAAAPGLTITRRVR